MTFLECNTIATDRFELNIGMDSREAFATASGLSLCSCGAFSYAVKLILRCRN